jgi:hypothetical protein
VMQYHRWGKEGRIHKQFKPDIDFEKSADDQRQQMWEYLWKNFGGGSTESTETHFDLSLRGATALYEANSDVGAVHEIGSEFKVRRLTKDTLNAIVYGLNNKKYPVISPEVRQRCTEIYEHSIQNMQGWDKRRAHEQFKWTPNKGMDLKILKGVNGGFKVDHPIITGLLVETIDAQPIKSGTDFLYQEQYLRAHRIAGGHPEDLYQLMEGLVTKILDAIDPGDLKRKEAGQNMRQKVSEIQQSGIKLGKSVWFDFTNDEPFAQKEGVAKKSLQEKVVYFNNDMEIWTAAAQLLIVAA